jgi:DNA-binding NarL/FixJ family response regulator
MSACVSRFSAWRPRTSAKAWSPQEVATLRQLAEAGESIRIIALNLRRTESAVRNKAGMHGISLAVKSAAG